MAKKRMPNGYGTMPRQLEDGRWRIDVTIPTDGINKRKSVYGKSQEEVINKLSDIKKQIESGIDVAASNITLGAWLDKGLTTYNSGNRHNTITSYEVTIKLRIPEEAKKIPLKKLRHKHVQDIINDGAKKYSVATCRMIRAVLSQALGKAVKNQIILVNPADGLDMPKVSEKKIAVPLEKSQLQALLNNVKENQNYIYYVLSVYTGARIGEVLGLSWKDIDFKNNVIHVRHTLTLNKKTGQHELGATKTGKERTIPILPMVAEQLKTHKTKQNRDKLAFGNGYNSNNMVFCGIDGGYMPIIRMARELGRVAKRIGIKATPHTLRHTFASQLISGNVNIKLVSELLGHSDINITLNVYGHLLQGDTCKAIAVLAEQMGDLAI